MKDGVQTEFALDASALKTEAGQVSDVTIPAVIGDASPALPSTSGTRLVLSHLRHSTPMDIVKLREALGRRFSRTVLGSMRIYVNGEEVTEPALEYDVRFPPSRVYDRDPVGRP